MVRIRHDRTVGHPAIVLFDLRSQTHKSIGSDLGNAIKGFAKRYPMTEQANLQTTQQKYQQRRRRSSHSTRARSIKFIRPGNSVRHHSARDTNVS
ncbi:MAG: hypothetical protein CM15mP68_5470 [Pseudomonadota bacterium]|nr:MAG: hypothetical protein CM15mP68_5470 [Pseudomonadota bacterium]